ncbi:MAG: tRNA epoxyqueuosine(34) reductase QueG [Bryobacteraceae bacterium]|nr:tRNA epoxyqueuosine(34) reductase QueG [Bryobacteraceae bacterium]MDW8378149.1 tRNA epoxyqueuosine(34) reductase QueG [Bryobacterales bacterium]
MPVQAEITFIIKRLAQEAGFELVGVAPAHPAPDWDRYADWVARGLAGRLHYLTDHRAQLRTSPKNLLPSARSVICVGKLYNLPWPYSNELSDLECAWISRYAWGTDYHVVIRNGLEQLARRMREEIGTSFEFRICVDTAPLLERSLARRAGLGWIGKNTCLINQERGSWFFLGEMLVSLELEPDFPAAERCGSCTRCIEACPTQAIVASPQGGWELDARLCISYFTIELRGEIPSEHRAAVGRHVFGCDICQEVCPWNRRAPITGEPAFAPASAEHIAPRLDRLARLTHEEFRQLFRHTPVERARYTGFLRNVAVAMGNSKQAKFLPALERLAEHSDPVVAEHARWAIAQILES